MGLGLVVHLHARQRQAQDQGANPFEAQKIQGPRDGRDRPRNAVQDRIYHFENPAAQRGVLADELAYFRDGGLGPVGFLQDLQNDPRRRGQPRIGGDFRQQQLLVLGRFAWGPVAE